MTSDKAVLNITALIWTAQLDSRGVPYHTVHDNAGIKMNITIFIHVCTTK